MKNLSNMGSNMYDKEYSPGSVPSEHTIYFTVELYNEPNKVFLSSKMTTQIKNFNDLGQDVIEFPVKIKDLSIMSFLKVKLYDMNHTKSDGLVATSVLRLFDIKKRLRQGVVSLHLSKSGEDNDEYTNKINNLWSRVGLDPVLDKKTEDCIRSHLDEYYEQSQSGYLEVCLQGFGYPVLYAENAYKDDGDIKSLDNNVGF